MARDFRASDKGLKVVTDDGETIGTVEQVSDGEAHVKPDSGLPDSMRDRLGWTAEGEEMYRLDHDTVAEITDTEVRLKGDM